MPGPCHVSAVTAAAFAAEGHDEYFWPWVSVMGRTFGGATVPPPFNRVRVQPDVAIRTFVGFRGASRLLLIAGNQKV
jgi:hypothetical protein